MSLYRHRLAQIQIMRGVAAMAVVFAHAVDLAVDNTNQFGRSYIANFLFLDNFGAIGVDFFFVISGFVMARSSHGLNGMRNTIGFLVDRITRIAPLYYLATIIKVFCILLVGGSVSPKSLTNALIFIPLVDVTNYNFPPLSVGWTLSFEFTFYAFLSIFIFLRCTNRAIQLVIALFTLVLLGILFYPKKILIILIKKTNIFELKQFILYYLAWSLKFF
jgi:exopolysaccharide production protein ExoZ